ncbi:ATP-dependent DNA helicase [Frankliniella fusca]|uniref:ATP-dependent DNA helicase n=1 Tax=Frankliniella fusca TaxID=407009 RepID=A0AAE1HJN7_9NEOP|nr:ATP-dependent DNA helicase [Frankliniella fusca]
MSSLVMKTCLKCKKKVMKSCYDKDRCQDCHLFTNANGMDPGDLPEQLTDLSFVEQQLIAKVHPVVSVYRIRKGEQLKYSGQVINFPQNVQEICNVLPQTVQTLQSILTIRVEGSDGYKDFQVRRQKVYDALVWLKINNPFYEDIELSTENIQLLPEDGNVYYQTNGYDIDKNSDLAPLDLEGVHYVNYSELEDEELDGIDFKHVPDIGNVSQKDKIGHSFEENVLLWPSIGSTPLNEFGSPGYITMAFTHLFPFGKADYSNRANNEISLTKYIQHLMLFYDERFAKDPRFRFFMMNSQMRWQALNVGNIYVKKNNFFSEFTVLQLKEYLKSHPELISNIMFYSSRLRSTKAYWKSRCSELLDMVSDLGAPTIFFTLSSADYHWKDLFRLFGVDNPSSISVNEKTKLIGENPRLVSTFFKLRCEHLLHKCFFKRFDVVDYWYRVEYQHRGSCHVHGVIWIKGAPNVKNVKTEEEKQKVKEFFDKLVSCENPDLSFTPNLIHPCERCISDCTNLEDDLAELVNRVQRHTKCSTSYCLTKDRHNNELSCRFGFPKELRDETELIIENDELQIHFRCNDILLNKYNAWVLQTWRSNIDFTAIVSEDILYRYIAKYAAKCEIKSVTYDDLLQNILSQTTGDNLSCKKIIRKLIISTCAERDYSAQEVMYILMSYPLFHCSRQFVILNLKESIWETASNTDNSKKLTFVEHYMKRPVYLDSICLLECAKLYNVRKGQWVKCKKPAVVRVFPRRMTVTDSEYTDLKNVCILNVPWRDISKFNVDVKELQDELTKIGYDWHCEDERDVHFEWSDSDCDDQDDNDENEIDCNGWNYISGLKSKRTQKKVKQNGSDNFCWDYAWNKYNIDTLHSICREIETIKVGKDYKDFDYTKLSHDQQFAFNHFKDLIDGFKKTGEWCKERLFFVQGRAGYGKSFLLNALRTYCFEKLGQDSSAVVAYSGVAAKNVDGETIHSFLRIPPKPQYFQEMSSDTLRLFPEKKQKSYSSIC